MPEIVTVQRAEVADRPARDMRAAEVAARLTPATPPRADSMALDMVDTFSRIPGLTDLYGHELGQIRAAAERAAETVERERARLTRPDGSAVYAPQEHEEREAAIIESATAAYDAAVARYADRATRDAEEARTKLAVLEGFDPYDRLSDAEKQAASTRAAFVREDCETLPPHELVKQARAALASGDTARIYLYGRYLGRRIEATRGQPGAADVELLGVARDLAAAFDDGDRAEQRRDLERKVRATEGLTIAITAHRNGFNGSMARL